MVERGTLAHPSLMVRVRELERGRVWLMRGNLTPSPLLGGGVGSNPPPPVLVDTFPLPAPPWVWGWRVPFVAPPGPPTDYMSCHFL